MVIAQLTAAADITEARQLVERNALNFDTNFDALFGVYEHEALIAVGARAGNILKMLVIEPSHQGGSVLGEIVTALVSQGYEAGIESFFVFTKPEFATSFEALNFTLLASQSKVALLEYGNGLSHWLASLAQKKKPGKSGAVVVNCNPFTFGHRYLLECAASQVDNLYVFVVREDCSCFPFDVRFRLVREGVRDLRNIVLLDTSHYIVSSATFPTYFLKKDDPVAHIQMELDVTLFASRIAPFFDITQRFVGTEPYCALTKSYNETMKRILPMYGIELVEMERKVVGSGVISASRVRDLIARNALSDLNEVVPECTLNYLLSDEAAAVRRQLQQDLQG